MSERGLTDLNNDGIGEDMEQGEGYGTPGYAFPSFATSAYYQALSQDERQYGEEAEYRQQFYNFIEQLYNDIYDALVSGRDTITRGDKYEPYKDSATLAAPVDAFFDEIFGETGTVSVADVLENDLFSQAVTEYNRAPGEFDFAAGWSQLQNAEQMQASAETEQKETLWETQILPALEAGGEFIQTAIFGSAPSGGPKTFDEMFEEWMQSQMDQLKGPLTVTFDPSRGLLAEIMIPVGFEVNGSPLELPIFDADGNFVLPQTIEDVFISVNPQGQNIIEATIDGVTQQIGEIFTNPDGTVITRIFDAAGNVVSELGLGGLALEDGSATGVLTGAVLSGDIFYNQESGRFEEGEEGTLGPDDDLINGDTDFSTEEGPVDANGDGIDDNTGLPIDEGPLEPPENEEDTGKKETDLGDFDPTPEFNEDFDGDGIPDYLDADDDNDGVPDKIDGNPLDPNVGETFGPDEGAKDDKEREPPVLVPRKDPPQEQEDDRRDQGTGQQLPPADMGDFQPIPDVPPVTGETTGGEDRRDGGGEEGSDEQGELPIQGAPGATGASGARGAPGASAPRPGFMGGLSYQLPGFVGVEYQPKDYMRELDRIIGESLFGDMI